MDGNSQGRVAGQLEIMPEWGKAIPDRTLKIIEHVSGNKRCKTVRISFDTIEWDNEADLDPEFLYQKSIRIH